MTGSKNVAASVRQKLLNQARADGRPFNELLQYYAMERFLYRLSRSNHTERFILKGALMLRVWVSVRNMTGSGFASKRGLARRKSSYR